MDNFFGMIGLLGIIGSVIVLIVFGIQKKPLKIPFIVLGTYIVFFIFGATITGSSSSAYTSTTQTNDAKLQQSQQAADEV